MHVPIVADIDWFLSRSFSILPKSLCSPFLIAGCFTDTFDKVFCSGELWSAPVLI